MDEDKKKHAHGGRRPGAGRPKGDSQLFAFRAGGETVKYINRHANKTQCIIDCIEAQRQREQEERLGRIGKVYAAKDLMPTHLPYFDISVVAGFPIPLDNDELAKDIELMQMLCPHPESSYLIRVHGDSMIEAGIHTDDILIVDKSNRNPTEKQVALCELNGEYTIKYVRREDGKGWLLPANPNFPTIEIKEGDDFSVWGVVTYVIHKPRA